VTLTHPEKSDNLDDVLLKDFMKKRDIWGDQWIIPEERNISYKLVEIYLRKYEIPFTPKERV